MPIRRPFTALAAALLSTVGVAASAGTATAAPASPLGDYIVVLADDAPLAVAAHHARGLGGRIGHTYRHALNGFSVSLPAQAAARLSALPGVVDVEPVVTVQAKPQPAAPATSSVPWGLDRIDQRALPLSTRYSPAASGFGVTAYVIDSGINLSHQDLAGRVLSGADEVDGGSADDCNGHGTHVAGTIGGTARGVARQVTLVAVRVLDCSGSGTTDDVIAGIDWVTGDHLAGGGPAVANLSLGGGANTLLDDAVQGSIEAGVTYTVAAGNGNQAGRPQDACASSPARVPDALTVAATDSSDTVASFSNYGTCVDLYAPGVAVTSDWWTSSTATNTISGTSMAAPHVAGVAALYLQANPAALPAAVSSAISGSATANAVRRGAATTPNRLLYTAPAV